MRPSLRAFWLVLVAVPMALLLLAFDSSAVSLTLYYLLLVAFLVLLDLAACPPARRLDFAIEEPARLFIGDRGSLKVSAARKNGAVLSPVDVAIEVNDILDLSAQDPVTIPEGAVSAEIELRPHSRGIATIDRVWFRWSGPMGLVCRQVVEAPALRIPVVPNLQLVAQAANDLVGAAAEDIGQRASPLRGEGSEFTALRDYVPGMDPRTVDWKRSARYRGLLVKEFETERNHQVILAYDTGHLMKERLSGITRLDHMVNAGLVLAHAALRGGDRVGLFSFDAQVRTMVKPLSGMAAYGHLQHYLAGLECADSETNYTLAMTRLAEQLTRRTLVILFTDFVDTTTSELMHENLSRLAVHHFVVFVALEDPYLNREAAHEPETVKDIAKAAMASELLKERRLLFNRLRRQGILCIEPGAAHLVGQVLRQYRTIINRELV
ncbi:MAG: DUF58 domain-containing protein [Alphaproteobacteria bacterium]|nr:MAG: DUF58 domain-containing protein [Alphaproteobacteria bacterium]